MTCLQQVLIYLLSCLSLMAQGTFEPIFQPFEGTVYRLPYDSLNKGYGDYVYDLEPYKTITWSEINQEWRSSKMYYPDIDLSHSFGIDFSSKLSIPTDGLYLFGLKSDDDSILWIDGKKVLNNASWNKKPMALSADTIYLSQGEHDVRLWYSQLYPDMMGVQFRAKFIKKAHPIDYIEFTQSLRLNYESGTYHLTEEHAVLLDGWLKKLEANKVQPKINVVGYTDEVGWFIPCCLSKQTCFT